MHFAIIIFIIILSFQVYSWWLRLSEKLLQVSAPTIRVFFPLYKQSHLTWDDLKPKAEFSPFIIYKMEQT